MDIWIEGYIDEEMHMKIGRWIDKTLDRITDIKIETEIDCLKDHQVYEEVETSG